MRSLMLSAILTLVPTVAFAQPVPVDLKWRAPAECPQREEILARVRKLLGASASTSTTVRAEGELEARPDGFELRLRIDDGGNVGERTVRSRHCNELGSAAAIALALLLNSNASREQADTGAPPATEPNAGEPTPPNETSSTGTPGESSTTSSPPSAPSSSPSSPPPSTPSSSSPVPSSSSEPSSRSWRLLVAAPELAVDFGPLPRPTVGVGAGIGVESGSSSLRFAGHWSFLQRLGSAASGYGAEVRYAALGLWACHEFRSGALSAAPCFQATASWLHAKGYGPFLRAEPKNELWLGLGVGGIARVRLSDWLSLILGAGARVELSRPRIVLEQVGTLGQLAPVAATLCVGPEWIF